MMIDRHNYEEFFLLYTDNELTPEQRKSVELFVSQNPDLQEEFEMLQQLKLTPDNNIIFGQKDHLYRTTAGSSPINLSNYEDYLILYADNELTEKQRKETELFAENNPLVRKELELYLNTKLQPEAEITFPDKDSLYRKERVATMRWIRIAAAAVVILAIGITALLLLNQKHSGGFESLAGVEQQAGQTVTPPSSDEKTGKHDVIDQQKGTPHHSPEEKIVNNKKSEYAAKKANTEKGNNKSEEAPLLVARESHPLPSENTLSPTRRVEKITTEILPLETNAKTEPALLTDFNNSLVTAKPSYALNIINAADDDGNKKSRGLFRKATRFFERTTNIDATTSDNKLLIGSFAINLK